MFTRPANYLTRKTHRLPAPFCPSCADQILSSVHFVYQCLKNLFQPQMVSKHEVIQATRTSWISLPGPDFGELQTHSLGATSWAGAETEPKSLCQHRGRVCGCTSESSSPASAQLPCEASGQPLLSNGLHLVQATAGLSKGASDPQPPLCCLRP